MKNEEKKRIKGECLRHYTSLPRLIEILSEKQIPMMNPAFWIDKNDAFSVNESSDSAVGVICFSDTEQELSHMWENYAKRGIGVCVLFYKEGIKKLINGKNNYKLNKITYLRFKKNKDTWVLYDENVKFKIKEKSELAFVKRIPYCEEHEYRLAFFSDQNRKICGNVVSFLQINFSLKDLIHEIYLSPFLDKEQEKDVKCLLEAYLKECKLSEIKVKISKMAEDVRWRNAIRRLK